MCFLFPSAGDDEDASFDFDCGHCLQLLVDPATTISQIFAIIRLWVPTVQVGCLLFCVLK